MVVGRLNSRLHRLQLIALGLVVCFSMPVSGLGLGDIHYTTVLGEKLEARIKLISPGDLAPENIIVRRLRADQARQLGVDLVDSFYRFELKPIIEHNQLVLSVTTAEAITEPFVNLLVELRWPKGQVLREYTLLFDPPSVVAAQQSIAAAPAAKPSRQPTLQRVSSVSPVQFDAAADRYRVVPGDTLSKIAGRLRRGSANSLADVSQWLFENNRKAFIGADPNRLKAGAVLVLPAIDGGGLAGSSTSAVETKAVGAERGGPDAAEPDRAVLRLLKPQPEAQAANEAKSEAESGEQLQQRLASTRELIDQLRRENDDLRRRLERIEQSGYEQSLEKLIDLKDEQIFDLKRQVREFKYANASPTDDDAQANKTLALEGAPPATSGPEKAASGGFNQLWWYLLGLAALIALIVYWLRRQPSAEELTVTFEDTSSEESPPPVDEKALLDELSSLAGQAPSSSTATGRKAKSTSRFRGITGAGRVAKLHEHWRADDEVKREIEEKMRTYRPPADSGSGIHHDTDGSHLDERISEALAYASAGKFDLAEAILISEQVESGDDQRLEDALHYVEKMRDMNG